MSSNSSSNLNENDFSLEFQNIDLEDDEKKEQLTRPSEYLDYLSKQLMNDYAKYFQLRPTAQVSF